MLAPRVRYLRFTLISLTGSTPAVLQSGLGGIPSHVTGTADPRDPRRYTVYNAGDSPKGGLKRYIISIEGGYILLYISNIHRYTSMTPEAYLYPAPAVLISILLRECLDPLNRGFGQCKPVGQWLRRGHCEIGNDYDRRGRY
jgi:hypothetical protein